MSEIPDPFGEIVAGLELCESGLREFETISPEAILAIHGALLARARPYDLDQIEDLELLASIMASLEIELAYDFEHIDTLRVGDPVKFSQRGLVMTYDEDSGGGMEFLGRGVSVSGIVSRPIAAFAPIDLDKLAGPNPEDFEEHNKAIPMKIAAGISLDKAVMLTQDRITGLVEEDPYDDAAFVFVPLLYQGMKTQREITRTIQRLSE